MYWLSIKFKLLNNDFVLTPHFGTRRSAKEFYDFMVNLCESAGFACKLKFFKNMEVIEKCRT